MKGKISFEDLDGWLKVAVIAIYFNIVVMVASFFIGFVLSLLGA